MARAEAVVRALIGFGKPAQAVDTAQGVHPAAAAGQYLMHIALVADVKDQLVLRNVKNPVQGDGQFHHAQVGGEVAARMRNRLDQKRAYLAGELLEFVHAQVFEIPRTFNKVQYAHSFASRFLRILPVKTGAAGACA